MPTPNGGTKVFDQCRRIETLSLVAFWFFQNAGMRITLSHGSASQRTGYFEINVCINIYVSVRHNDQSSLTTAGVECEHLFFARVVNLSVVYIKDKFNLLRILFPHFFF